MPMLAKPETIAGPLGPSDLAEARAHSTGAIWLLPRRGTVMQCPPCTGNCRQGRDCTGPDTVPTDWHDDCAPEGGKFAEPAPAMESMLRHRRTQATVRGGVALVALLAVCGYVVRAVWPMA